MWPGQFRHGAFKMRACVVELDLQGNGVAVDPVTTHLVPSVESEDGFRSIMCVTVIIWKCISHTVSCAAGSSAVASPVLGCKSPVLTFLSSAGRIDPGILLLEQQKLLI